MSDPYILLRNWVTPGELPPEFDDDFYRLLHDDLWSFSNQQRRHHYEKWGRGEGRLASPAAQRRGFIHAIPRTGALLEIGPFNRPSLVGGNVKYFDVLDQTSLIKRANDIGIASADCPNVDFVSSTGDLSIVHEKFDVAFSSHCIEHQADIIRHLNNVSSILNDGGIYYLAVPDKRYCFDHFIEPSRTIEMIVAYKEQRNIHTFKSVYEHSVLTTHNDPERHWQGDSEDPRLGDRAARADYAMRRFAEANGSYIDVHAWQFTPDTFRNCMNDLCEQGLSTLRPLRVYDTPYGHNEFMAALAPTRNAKGS